MTGSIANEKSRLMFRLALYQVIKKECDQMITSQERVLKINKVIFQLSYYQKVRRQSFIKIEGLSQELFMSEFQYQNITKWWWHQWLGSNLWKPRSFLAIIPKKSQTKFHQIQITKSKVIHVQISVPKWEKTKKLETIFWVIKRGNKGIRNRGRF